MRDYIYFSEKVSPKRKIVRLYTAKYPNILTVRILCIKEIAKYLFKYILNYAQ